MTKLAKLLLCAVSLLLAPQMFAQGRIASPRNFRWCDLHACQEPAHYVGTASYYGRHHWQGRKMANGERFDYRKLTAACWFLPLGTQAQVLNLRNGETVTVEITDRGPAHRLHRVIDLSQAAADKLDLVRSGLAIVMIRPAVPIEPTEIAVPTTLEEPQIDGDRIEVAGVL